MQDDDRIVVIDADLVPDGDKATTYTLRPLTREVRRKIIKARTSKRPNPRTHQMEDVVDWQDISMDLLDYALVAWDGILWNGGPAPCEREYKSKLDEMRLTALLERAGLSKVVAAEEQRDQSFRQAG
jgi:hypothetical protein